MQIDELEFRLAVLERSNQRLKRMLWAMALGVAATVTLAASPIKPQRIETSEILLKTDGTTPDGIVLRVRKGALHVDSEYAPTGSLRLNPFVPSISLDNGRQDGATRSVTKGLELSAGRVSVYKPDQAESFLTLDGVGSTMGMWFLGKTSDQSGTLVLQGRDKSRAILNAGKNEETPAGGAFLVFENGKKKQVLP